MPTISNPTAYGSFTNTLAGVVGWPSGQERFYPYYRTTSCDDAKAVITNLVARHVAATTNPAKTAIMNELLDITTTVRPVAAFQAWSLRTCGAPPPSGPDVVTDWQEEAEPAEEPPPAATTGASRVISSNADQFVMGIQWQNGKARPVLLVQPTPGAGEQLWIFINGQPAVNALPTSYAYLPGDETRFYLTVAADPNPYIANYNKKADVQMYFGNPPA